MVTHIFCLCFLYYHHKHSIFTFNKQPPIKKKKNNRKPAKLTSIHPHTGHKPENVSQVTITKRKTTTLRRNADRRSHTAKKTDGAYAIPVNYATLYTDGLDGGTEDDWRRSSRAPLKGGAARRDSADPRFGFMQLAAEPPPSGGRCRSRRCSSNRCLGGERKTVQVRPLESPPYGCDGPSAC